MRYIPKTEQSLQKAKQKDQQNQECSVQGSTETKGKYENQRKLLQNNKFGVKKKRECYEREKLTYYIGRTS